MPCPTDINQRTEIKQHQLQTAEVLPDLFAHAPEIGTRMTRMGRISADLNESIQRPSGSAIFRRIRVIRVPIPGASASSALLFFKLSRK
jgi:hypothetical protein